MKKQWTSTESMRTQEKTTHGCKSSTIRIVTTIKKEKGIRDRQYKKGERIHKTTTQNQHNIERKQQNPTKKSNCETNCKTTASL